MAIVLYILMCHIRVISPPTRFRAMACPPYLRTRSQASVMTLRTAALTLSHNTPDNDVTTSKRFGKKILVKRC